MKTANPMRNKAKLYIAIACVAGFSVLAGALLSRPAPKFPHFLGFLVLMLLASTLKVQLPGLTGTMSVSFLFILMGIADYTFSETILAGCAGALVQSVWKARRRPKLEQVLFNISALVISSSVAYWGSHFVLGTVRANSLIVLLSLAACLFFLGNTGLIVTVISLVEEKPLRRVWDQCYAWSFPYYLVGAGIAALVSMVNRSVSWSASLLVLPAMYLTYVWYRQFLEAVAHKVPFMAAGHLHELGVSSSEETQMAREVAD